MESPISRSYIVDVTFNQIIKEAKQKKIKDTIEKIGELESEHKEQGQKDLLCDTSKERVKLKFKALKNAGKSF